MFGLEKKSPGAFEFDLEKDLKRDKKMKENLFKTIEERSQELKKVLREGEASEDFEKCGILLHAYSSLQKVLKVACK